MPKKKSELTPPDLNRCQTYIKEGSFMTFGPRPEVRCHKKAYAVITEKKVTHKDGEKGSMSVCSEHLKAARKQFPRDHFEVKKINRKPDQLILQIQALVQETAKQKRWKTTHALNKALQVAGWEYAAVLSPDQEEVGRKYMKARKEQEG